ncbi:MAG: signal peptidase I [Chloroflexi bacterium]|nr:signal peptidase I [Chloroflexota bacterium]
MNLRQVILLILAFLLIFGMLRFSLQSYKVEGSSMEPLFHNREYLIVDKLTYHFRSPARGDVIVFHNPQSNGVLLIKRIIGMPGEKVEIKGGELYINGYRLQEKPGFSSIPYPDYSVTVPKGHYWVIGDNRSSTTGSHVFGPVPRSKIVGRVWVTYWPPSDWGFSPKYSAGPVPITA